MRYFRFLLPLIVGIILAAAMDRGMGILPPMGRLLSPFQGFWQNARNGYEQPAPISYVPGLKAPVNVFTDEHQVPHIVAANNEDLPGVHVPIHVVHALAKRLVQKRPETLQYALRV